MRKTIKQEEFNRMVTVILLQFMEFTEIPPTERQQKLEKFNQFLNDKQNQLKNEESLQLGQNDLVTK